MAETGVAVGGLVVERDQGQYDDGGDACCEPIQMMCDSVLAGKLGGHLQLEILQVYAAQGGFIRIRDVQQLYQGLFDFGIATRAYHFACLVKRRYLFRDLHPQDLGPVTIWPYGNVYEPSPDGFYLFPKQLVYEFAPFCVLYKETVNAGKECMPYL